MKKNTAILIQIFLLLCLDVSFSQNKNYPQTYAAPNTYSLTQYGNIPSNHFTGIPQINVPIFTLKTPYNNIPLNLNYNVSAVKPNVGSGWTGLGWNLSAGGAITRTINGKRDEFGGNSYSYFARSRILDTDDWASKSNLRTYTYRANRFTDLQADEFNFNFLGYSGSFYLNHKGDWVVKSSSNLKVEFNPFEGGFIGVNSLIGKPGIYTSVIVIYFLMSLFL